MYVPSNETLFGKSSLTTEHTLVSPNALYKELDHDLFIRCLRQCF